MQAIRIIHDEHRSLAAVLHGMLHLVHAIRDRGVRPDFNVLGAMIYYIDAFPERFHHPKEDEYLFAFLRIRHPDAIPLLDRLKSEHRAGAEKIRTLEQALARYQQGGAQGVSGLPGRGRGLRGIPLAAHENRGGRGPAARAETLDRR